MSSIIIKASFKDVGKQCPFVQPEMNIQSKRKEQVWNRKKTTNVKFEYSKEEKKNWKTNLQILLV
jgi:hypothetical protein